MKFLIVFAIFIAYTLMMVQTQSDRDAIVLSHNQVVNPDGSYSYNWETSNSISVNEQGIGGVRAVGEYQYISPEGVPVAISYVADENGYQPSGDLLPTPPEIPPLIKKALEYLARNAPSIE